MSEPIEDIKADILKNCPKCGMDNAEIVHGLDATYQVKCYKDVSCQYRTEWYATEQEAIAAWNRRASEPNEPLTLDELRERVGKPVWCKERMEWQLVFMVALNIEFRNHKGSVFAIHQGFTYFDHEPQEST